MIIPVILSGGSGTRLWPLSRKFHPKQFLNLVNEKTTVDLAVAYALQIDETAKHFINEDINTKHSQTSVTVGVNFAF